MDIEVGKKFRDRYGDNDPRQGRNLRTIVVAAIWSNGVVADVLTDSAGNPVAKPRRTTLMFKTLRAGYEPIAP